VNFATDTNIPITYQTLSHQLCSDYNISIDVKRLDLLHPLVNGNKWYKLKYNKSVLFVAKNPTN